MAKEDIRTAAHSPKGDKAYPRHCVEDERPSNAVRHIPIGWGDERGVTRHGLSLLTTPTKRNEHPPQPSTIGHEHPPPGSTVGDEGPIASTKPTTRIDERLRGPITTINKGPLPGSINGYDRPQPRSTNGHKGPLAPPSTNGHGRPRRSTNGKSPSKRRCQPKCKGGPNTNPSPNTSTPHRVHIHEASHDASTSVCYQCGELRAQYRGEGTELSHGEHHL